jgi:signal transduction histidine kinase
MSIRVRFTLVYNLILLATLTVFSVALYNIQAINTLRTLKSALTKSSDEVAINLIPLVLLYPPSLGPNLQESDPRLFENLSNALEIKSLREREIVRVLDASGNLVAAPFGLADKGLPISKEGMEQLQNGNAWWETTNVGVNLLVLNRPIIVDNQLYMILQIARPLTEREQSLHALRNTLIAADLVVLVLASIIGWVLSGYLLRPIKRITQTAQQIGNEQNFSRRVDYNGPNDEVGQLAKTFNTMLEQLEEAYKKVSGSLEMQRDFLADVSHELRTPLTTLRGNLGLLRHEPPIPEDETADILNDMVDETDRMIRLVNELLEQARADSTKNMLLEPVNLKILLQDVVRQAKLLSEDRQISLDIPDDLSVMATKDALKQVMLILVDNAIKHSQRDIVLEAQRVEDEVEIRVIDHGKGLSPEELTHVFERFYRADRLSGNGFGLGLSIAKGLVENMNGQISMASEIGVGTTVMLRFKAAEREGEAT